MSSTMRVALINNPGSVALRSVERPTPGTNDVRIRVEGCGVCGSSIPLWEGRGWFDYPRAPGEPGHEGWGRIDAVGPAVVGVQVGQRVAALTYNAFAEYDIAPANAVAPLPPSLDDAPFPGEAFGCAMNVFRRAAVHRGDIVAIIGIGFLGAVLTRLASTAGAIVIAVSRRPFALEFARLMGAAEALSLDDVARVREVVGEHTAGQGCDRVIEAVGLQGPLDLAGELTRERGRLVIAGFHQDGRRAVDMQLWNWRGLDVVNAHERQPTDYMRGIREGIEAVVSGRIDPDALCTHRYDLDRLGSALDSARRRPAGFLKAVVTP